jgi:hypothetical protein
LARRLIAAAFILGMSAPVYGAVPYPPPTTWKGINYSPRRHSYFRMLYDWGSWDSTAGQYVHQMVDADLTRLSQNGFNLVHLYLWDQEMLRVVAGQPNEPAGFLSAPSDPSASPNNQWENLNDFVTKAEAKGLFVALHFASGRLFNRVAAGDNPDAVSTEFANWAGAFIQHLNSTHQHWNVLTWGLQYSFGPYPWDLSGTHSTTWRKTYKKVDDKAKQYSPAPYVLGLIGANLAFNHLRPSGQPWVDYPGIFPRGSGYTWDWQNAQQTAQAMRTLLTQEYGGAKDPDIYMMQLYHPNSYDLKTALQQLTTGYVFGGLPVPGYRIFVVEFATSSSLNSTPDGGNNIPYYGDAQTPTTTSAGLSQWLTNTLCVYQGAGIDKMAYWSMYDPYTLWTGAPWYLTGQALAWSGFWGLSYERESYGDKSAWSTLRSYYLNGTLACGSPFPINATPVVSLTPSTSYYTVNQPVRVTWTAADTASLSVNRSHTGSNSCWVDQNPRLISGTEIVGSCAYSDTAAFYTLGSQSVTFTGNNLYSTSRYATANFSIGLGPTVNAVTDQNYSYTINRYDTIVVWGNGFSLTGGNTIQLVRAGYSDVWMYEGDGHYFWDDSHTQINASLDGRAAAGQWTLYVRNYWSGTPSAAYSLTINP